MNKNGYYNNIMKKRFVFTKFQHHVIQFRANTTRNIIVLSAVYDCDIKLPSASS